MWENIVNTCKEIFNMPIVVAGVSIGTAGSLVLIFLKSSSIGKKSLNFLKKSFKSLTTDFETLKGGVEKFQNDTREFARNTSEQINKSIVLFREKQDSINGLIEVICENTHNEKIKAAFDEYKQKSLEINESIDSDIKYYEHELEARSNDLNAKATELENQLTEKIAKADALIEKLEGATENESCGEEEKI